MAFHRVLGRDASEAGEEWNDRSEFIHGQLQELFEGGPIVDLGFQLGDRIDVNHCCRSRHFKAGGDGSIVPFRLLPRDSL